MSNGQNFSDSSGVPWEGREFHQNPHAGDSGETQPAVASALSGFSEGVIGVAEIVNVLSASRALIPLLTNPGEDFDPNHPVMEDKVQELSIVTLVGPEGEAVLPAFTSVEAMKKWNGDSRPIPIEMQRVALAAASEGADRIVVNPGTEKIVLRRPMVWAIAQGEPYVSPAESNELFEHLSQLLTRIEPIEKIELLYADPELRGGGPELAVIAYLPPGLSETELNGVLTRINEATASDQKLLQAAESLLIRFAAI